MSERRDPFYDVPKAEGIINHPSPIFYGCSGGPDLVSLPQGAQVYPSNEAIRGIVRVEVRKALNEVITEIRMQTGARF